MEVDIYATQKAIDDNIFCKLIVKSGIEISDFSEEITKTLGVLKLVKTMDINTKSTIIGLNSAKAIESINENGFYLSSCQIL